MASFGVLGLNISGTELTGANGGTLVGYGTTTAQDILNAVTLPDYPSLRAYSGLSKNVSITGYSGTAAPSGIAGDFTVDTTDTTSGAVFTGSIAPVTSPAAPILSATAGGTIAATTYFVKITYVTAAGETLPSAEASLAVAVNNVLNVASPAAQTGVTGYNVYVSTATGTETKQNTSPIAIGTAWVEPTTGLIAGAAVPTANTSGSVLTVSTVTNGTLSAYLTVNGSGVAAGTYVISLVGGTGGAGTYLINQSQTVASIGMTADNGGTIIIDALGRRWKRVYSGAVNVKWFGAKGDGSTNDTASIQSAINIANILYFPSSVYSVVLLSFIGRYITLFGDGIGNTVIQSIASASALINANESVDVRISPLVMIGMTIDCNGLAGSGIDIRYRHLTDFKNIRIINAVNQCVKAKDSWLMRMSQCEVEGSPIGIWLVGSNHRGKFSSISFQGCTTWHLKAEQNGTALDGNDSLDFDNCDIEFGSGGGAYLDVTSASFRSCYIGENISGIVMQVQNGSIEIDSGALFMGYTTSSIGIAANGGKTLFKKCRINGQTNSSISMLISGTGTNAVRFEDCFGNVIVGGDQTISGDLIDYGSQTATYCQKLGKRFTGSANNVTFSSAITNNSQKFTVLTAPGPTPLLGCYSTLINNNQWRDNENAYIVIVYESSKPASLKLSGSTLGGLPTINLGTLPATTGTAKTYIKLDASLSSAAYNIVELIQASSAVNDFITIYEFFLSDSRILNKGSSSFGNLYKC